MLSNTKITLFSLLLAGNFLFVSCGNSAKKHQQNEADTIASETNLSTTIEPSQPLWRSIKRAGEQNGNRFFTDENGNKLFEGKVFYNAHNFKNGYCIVSQKGDDGIERNGIIDEKGNFVVECIHENSIRDFENGFFEIANPKIGYLNDKGNQIIPMEYTSSKGFFKNVVKLQKQHKKWGILNAKGEEIVPFVYDEIGPWKEDLSAIKKNGKWGFVNLQGNEIIPCQYDFAYGFEHGIALVQKGKKFGFINAKNEVVIDFEYTDYKEITDVVKDEISETGYSQNNRRFVMEEGYIILKKEDKWGYIDTLGNIVIPFEYNYIGVSSSSGRVQIEKDKRRGNFDLKTKTESLY